MEWSLVITFIVIPTSINTFLSDSGRMNTQVMLCFANTVDLYIFRSFLSLRLLEMKLILTVELNKRNDWAFGLLGSWLCVRTLDKKETERERRERERKTEPGHQIPGDGAWVWSSHDAQDHILGLLNT